jgi:putative colanic acid biosynthesis UDP-glucose lipid carrier transferase
MRSPQARAGQTEAHNEIYRELTCGYMVRHKAVPAVPGITFLAQVRGLRGETQTLEQMGARVSGDLEYFRNRSVAVDPHILARPALRACHDGAA